MMRHALSFRVVLLLLTLAAGLPLIGLHVATLVRDYRHDAEQAEEGCTRLAGLVSRELDWLLGDAEEILRTLRSRPRIRAMDPSRCDPAFRDFLRLHPRFASLTLYDLEGRAVCSAAPIPGDARASVRDSSWFRRCLETREPVMSRPHADPHLHAGVTTLAQRVTSPRGRPIGALGLSIDFSREQRTLQRIPLPPGSSVTVLDRGGGVVAHAPDPERWVGREAGELLRERIPATGDEGALRIAGLDGIRRVVGFSRVNRVGWIVCVGLPESALHASAMRDLSISLGLSLLVFALSGLLAVMMGEPMARACLELVEAVRSFARDENPPKLWPRGPSELRGLTTSFNEMVVARHRMKRQLADAREQAHEARESTMRILEGATDAFVAIDRHWRFTYVNRRTGEVLGQSPESLLGRNVWRIVPELRGGPLHEACETAMADQEFRTIEMFSERIRRWLDVRVLPTPDGLLVFFRDVSDARRAAAERVELERRARHNETLAAVGVLVAAVAHEARGPLFGIQATVEALELQHGGRAELREPLASLKSASGRITRLMQNLLDFARPASTGSVGTDLGQAVSAAIELCRPEAEAAQVRVRLTLSANARVPAERERLILALRNLISNAIQHSPAGADVRIDVEAATAEGRDWIVCAVLDEGPGFGPEEIPNVFEPFYSGRPHGTGLGLFILQRIVEDAGGRVTVATRPEGGAALTVLLPTGGEGAPAPPPPADAERSGREF